MIEYEDRHINNMILFLRINRLAEMQYIDNEKNKFFDYQSNKWFTSQEVITLALENKWEKNWTK